MITVDEALSAIFALVAPLEVETVPLRHAAGRVMRGPARATRAQPPFDSSAMDGYAVAAARPGDRLTVIGESAAGHRFGGSVGSGEAVRIFTGAPVPDGATRVIIQEDVSREGDTITIADDPDDGPYIRPAGFDFGAGDAFTFEGPLSPVDLTLLAAMGHAEIPVTRRPEVAIIATGDELVAPGTPPGPDQIHASNNLGLAAMVERAGGTARLLPIARDTVASLSTAFDLARGSDLIVTIGGASVGDHDLVAQVAADRGMERRFYKVAMRPGKPLMAGRLDGTPMIGLPGNPVSSMVCGEIFIIPALRVLCGLSARPRDRMEATLRHDIAANGPRAHYMRGRYDRGQVDVMERQDSALLSVLARANCLVVRPPHDTERRAGETVEIIPLQGN